MLNITKVEPDLITDPYMKILFERGLKSGVSYISNKYSKPTISIWNLMTQDKNQNILYTETETIYMVTYL